MRRFQHFPASKHFVLLILLACTTATSAEPGVFVRLRLRQPENCTYYVQLGGYIHKPNWYLRTACIPKGADKEAAARVKAGEFTPWFDLQAHAGKDLHGRLNRAGGLAEFPNVTARFLTQPAATKLELEIELATTADEQQVVKRWDTQIAGNLVSFLVSPDLARDAKELELDSEMTARRLNWAAEATGGERHTPKSLLLQTQFWSPQRPELNLKEARVLWLLGFNTVGNMPAEVHEAFPDLRQPAASHDVRLDLAANRADVSSAWDKLAQHWKSGFVPGAPVSFQDEICARPPIGKSLPALNEFHAWLENEKIPPAELGVAELGAVQPIENPDDLRTRMKSGEPAARRIFYYTSRFRQLAGTERLCWNTAELHARYGANPRSSTLVADHPYFGGTGLGMGMDQQNTTWEGWPLALDWFDIGRRRAVDMIGIEDWMGLQFMYGPNSTWEGFQLMGFQAAIFRSAGRGQLPIMAWITPSDERNLRLKAASSLCQGATNFFYWCYGPTATSTENYWSDLQSCYAGMAHLSRLLEFGEPVLAAGHLRPTRVALLYSLSSDLWQPFGYIHMLDRRGLYFALIHAQYAVDMLTEEDIAAGRLKDYSILYSADPCISTVAVKPLSQWVADGGTFVASCAAGSRNQFGEPTAALAGLFGVMPQSSGIVTGPQSGRIAAQVEQQPCEYRVRGRLNSLKHLDRLKTQAGEFGITGLKVRVELDGGDALATFAGDGKPAAVSHAVGKGRCVYIAASAGVSYIKDANFVPADLAECWPEPHRRFLVQPAEQAGLAPQVRLSEPVVEAGVYESGNRLALVLANFTYKPIESLRVEVPASAAAASVRSLVHGELKHTTAPAGGPWNYAGLTQVIRFDVPLGHDDLILIELR